MAATSANKGGETRAFLLLEPDAQERVVILKTKYEKLLPLERTAFLQELGLISTRDEELERERQANLGKVIRYNNPRLVDVRKRDVGFVVLQQDPVVPSEDPDSYMKATTESTLRGLINPGLFGQEEVAIRKERLSIYEKIELTGDEGKKGDAEDEEPPAAPLGKQGELMYRNNAYQALRLAHSFPAHINVRPGTKDDDETTAMMNVTGIPVYEEELRRWFEDLDSDHTGSLDLNQFNQSMQALERDFGVKAEYEELQKAGEQLAVDGKLCYEAFAYLIMRFARA